MKESKTTPSHVSQLVNDDFKLINGIGPGIEKRLHSAGILTYTQLAELTPEQVVQRLGNLIGLTSKRMLEQEWIEQARQLETAASSKSSLDRSGRQHYATFTVELLLDEGNNVRRTRIVYIQAEKEVTWGGWDQAKLVDFIAENGELDLISPAEISEEMNLPTDTIEPVRLLGNPRLEGTRITSLDTGQESRILAKNQPFEINLAVDLAGLNIPAESEISYAAETYAKSLGKGLRQKIGESRGTFTSPEIVEMRITNPGLQEGTYRINVDLNFSQFPTEAVNQPELATNLDAGLLRVY